jgi:hypothetical protein
VRWQLNYSLKENKKIKKPLGIRFLKRLFIFLYGLDVLANQGLA